MTHLSDKDHEAQMAAMKASSFLHQPSDITWSACGRVAWNIDKFIVLVGHWAEPILDELTELLEKEFSLPYFEFVYDELMEQREERGACSCYPES